MSQFGKNAVCPAPFLCLIMQCVTDLTRKLKYCTYLDCAQLLRPGTAAFCVFFAQPNEAMVYEGLVQYIVEKHIIFTAELMVRL